MLQECKRRGKTRTFLPASGPEADVREWCIFSATVTNQLTKNA